MKLKIRAGKSADANVIFKLICELAKFEKLSHAVVGSANALKRTLFPKRGRRFAETLIAELDGKPVGFALFFHNYSTFLTKPGIYLEDLFVLPSARGHGIGEKMLKELAKIAKRRGCGRLEWSVLDWNKHAIRFYERLGAKGLPDWTMYRMDKKAIESMLRK